MSESKMHYCLKWENAQIAGIKLFKWNERLRRNNISDEHAIFVFRRHEDGRIKRILRFCLRFLMNATPDYGAGNFLPRSDGLAFSSVLFRSGLFWMRPGDDNELAKQLAAFTQASYEFSGFTANCPFSPRLVFVVDFTYTPVLHGGCPPSALPSVNGRGTSICTEPHAHMAPGVTLSDQDEEYALRMLPVYETDNEEEEEEAELSYMDLTTDPADVEFGYSEEMLEIVRRLRRYRNVERSFPLVPLSRYDPVGLAEVERPMMETVTAPPGGDCPICLAAMEEGQVVFKTRCRHVFHRECAMRWLSTSFSCPTCRTYSKRLL